MKFFVSIIFSLIISFNVNANSRKGLEPSRYLDVNGVQVAAYESKGKRGPGILMIHGNTSSANSFARIMKSPFARFYRITAIDLPGYGRSESAGALYSFGYFASVIANAAEQLGVDDGVMVGWSLGGDYVLQASTLMPHVKGYFLFGTAPFSFDPTLPPPFLTAEESYAGPAVNYGVVGDLPPELIADYVTAFFRPQYSNIPDFFFNDGLATDPLTRTAILTAALGQDPTVQDELQIVKTLTTPIALVLGEQEAFVSSSYMEFISPQIPMLYKGKTIIVKRSGHAVHWERPYTLMYHLYKFIKSLQ